MNDKGVIRVVSVSQQQPRELQLPQRTVRALGDYLAEQTDSASDLFVGRQGALSVEGIALVVSKYADWARLAHVTPKMLRHTFAFNYLEDHPDDLIGLADMLGHTNLNSTRVYRNRPMRQVVNT